MSGSAVAVSGANTVRVRFWNTSHFSAMVGICGANRTSAVSTVISAPPSKRQREIAGRSRERAKTSSTAGKMARPLKYP